MDSALSALNTETNKEFKLLSELLTPSLLATIVARWGLFEWEEWVVSIGTLSQRSTLCANGVQPRWVIELGAEFGGLAGGELAKWRSIICEFIAWGTSLV